MSQRTPPRLAGRALRAAVTAAESPMLGAGFKQLMFKQLGINDLLDLDLEPADTPPWSLPRVAEAASSTDDTES